MFRCRLIDTLQVLAFTILLGTSLYQRSLLKEAREQAAMYEEMLAPIVMCLANGGVVAHDGTSLRCVIRNRSSQLI